MALLCLLIPLLLFQQRAAASEPPTVGLALGSGGAYGLAHVAMLEIFDELDLRPHRIAGTSIGAVIGALYASGKTSGEIRALIEKLVARESDARRPVLIDSRLFRWITFLDPGLGEGGLIRGDAFIEFLRKSIVADTFEELEIPLRVIATDLNSREQVVFESGPLSAAVQASMAIPGLFAPVIMDERILVDGALVNPVPFDVLLESCDIVVAVNVLGHRDPVENPSLMECVSAASQIFQTSILREKMKLRAPDIHIEARIRNVHAFDFFEFGRVDAQARPAAEQLRKKLQDALHR